MRVLHFPEACLLVRLALAVAALGWCLPVAAQTEAPAPADLFGRPSFRVGQAWLVSRELHREVESVMFPEGAEREGEVESSEVIEREIYTQKVTAVDDGGRMTGALRFYREATMQSGEDEPVARPHAAKYAVYARNDEDTWSLRCFALEDGTRFAVEVDAETRAHLIDQAPASADDWSMIAALASEQPFVVGVARPVDAIVVASVLDWTPAVDRGELIPEQTRLTVTLANVTEDTATFLFAGSLGLRGKDPDHGADIVMFIEVETMELVYRRNPFQLVANRTEVSLGLYGKLDRDGRPFEIKGKGRFRLTETSRRP